jgi:hypothetical protein
MDNKCNYSKTGSCRKGKRSIYDKPKQPQRGLGVAQLEKLRMQNEIMANYIPSCQSPYQNGFEVNIYTPPSPIPQHIHTHTQKQKGRKIETKH